MIEVKNYGTEIIALSFNGRIVTIKPQQSTYLDEEIYKSYIKLFPNLRPITEYAIIEAEGQTFEAAKGKKNVGKNKKRGK